MASFVDNTTASTAPEEGAALKLAVVEESVSSVHLADSEEPIGTSGDGGQANVGRDAGQHLAELSGTGWLSHLREHGYAVVRGVAAPEQVERARDQLWASIEGSAKGLDRNDISTWEAWRLDRRGIILDGLVTQSSGAWEMRSLRGVRDAFSQIWETDDLLCSMDAVIAWKPWWINPAWIPRTEGLHMDQNPFYKTGFECVQGMIVLQEVTPESGGLEVVPGSHLPEAQQRLKDKCPYWVDTDDFCLIPPFHFGKDDRVLVQAQPGDLILWDSRTVHGGVVGTAKASPELLAARPELARLAIPVCMTPRSLASERTLRIRTEGFQNGSTFTHWPHEVNISRARPSGEYSPIELTSEQRSLL